MTASRDLELVPPGTVTAITIAGKYGSAVTQRQRPPVQVTSPLLRVSIRTSPGFEEQAPFLRPSQHFSSNLTIAWEGRSVVEETSHLATRRSRETSTGWLSSPFFLLVSRCQSIEIR
ncbi:hypothetical protein Bca52824_003088 [Brassica carinata]|uniref:Uncharacterized protein n=1 Tax=Brassica carinata TaxID=52824 RepID=A0A8X7WJ41_BRACI|nr:hypothetical protein Bca52824_003088 [Brassica carinata]